MVNLKSRLKTPKSSWYPATITRHNHIELLNVIEAAINEPVINGVVDGGNEQQRFLESCFGHFLRMHRGLQFSGGIVHRLLLRELHHDGLTDEMRFMLGSRSVRFSKIEFCLITGLKFGVIPDMTQIEEVENGLHQRYFSSRDLITLEELQARIVQGEWQQQYDLVKLCLVLLLNYFLIGLEEREYIPIWQLRLVDDLVSFEAFPWGSHVYKYSIYGFINALYGRRQRFQQRQEKKGIENHKKERYSIFGFAYALLVRICPHGCRPWHEVDTLLAPLNVGNCHWIMAKIDLTQQRIQLYDPFMQEVKFDHRNKQVACLRWFLPSMLSQVGFYTKRKKGVKVKAEPMDMSIAPKSHVPQQPNWGNCGPHTLKMIEYTVAKEKEFGWTDEDMSQIRLKMAVEVFSNSTEVPS